MPLAGMTTNSWTQSGRSSSGICLTRSWFPLAADATHERLTIHLIPFIDSSIARSTRKSLGVIAAVLLILSRRSASGRLRYEGKYRNEKSNNFFVDRPMGCGEGLSLNPLSVAWAGSTKLGIRQGFACLSECRRYSVGTRVLNKHTSVLNVVDVADLRLVRSLSHCLPYTLFDLSFSGACSKNGHWHSWSGLEGLVQDLCLSDIHVTNHVVSGKWSDPLCVGIHFVQVQVKELPNGFVFSFLCIVGRSDTSHKRQVGRKSEGPDQRNWGNLLRVSLFYVCCRGPAELVYPWLLVCGDAPLILAVRKQGSEQAAVGIAISPLD